jgi:formamidase
MARTLTCLLLAAFTLGLTAPDPALAKTVRIDKRGAKCADDPACHNRWHPAIKPAATADPGDTVVFGTRATPWPPTSPPRT